MDRATERVGMRLGDVEEPLQRPADCADRNRVERGRPAASFRDRLRLQPVDGLAANSRRNWTQLDGGSVPRTCHFDACGRAKSGWPAGSLRHPASRAGHPTYVAARAQSGLERLDGLGRRRRARSRRSLGLERLPGPGRDLSRWRTGNRHHESHPNGPWGPPPPVGMAYRFIRYSCRTRGWRAMRTGIWNSSR